MSHGGHSENRSLISKAKDFVGSLMSSNSSRHGVQHHESGESDPNSKPQ